MKRNKILSLCKELEKVEGPALKDYFIFFSCTLIIALVGITLFNI